MSEAFASSRYTAGQLNAIIKLLRVQAGEDGPERFLRGEVTVSAPSKPYRQEDGVTTLSVTSDGTDGEGWITRLEGKGYDLPDDTKQVLRSPSFKPTYGVTTEVVILKGLLFTDASRYTTSIRGEAKKRNLFKPNVELACLIRDKFSDREINAMGLTAVVVMHDPIKNALGMFRLLTVASAGDHALLALDGRILSEWREDQGFAFVVCSYPASPA
jgi:hypothetical protein